MVAIIWFIFINLTQRSLKFILMAIAVYSHSIIILFPIVRSLSSTLHPSAPRMPNSTNTHSDPQAHRAPPTPFVMHHEAYDATFDPFVMPCHNQAVNSYEYALHAATDCSCCLPPPIHPNQCYGNPSPNQQYYTPNCPITASDLPIRHPAPRNHQTEQNISLSVS